MDIVAEAQTRRCVKATKSNAESSRSHMVFTLHFSVTMKNGMKRAGRLNICDLAGSERLSKSGANSVVKVSHDSVKLSKHSCLLYSKLCCCFRKTGGSHEGDKGYQQLP